MCQGRTEERQTKQMDMHGLLTIREHQNFLEEGKFIDGGASVCSVRSVTPLSNLIFMVYSIM